MGISEIESHSALVSKIQNLENSYLLLYKSGTDNSECALKNLTSAAEKMENVNIFLADVSKVRDIHSLYNISSAPSLLEFNKESYINVVKGCQEDKYYTALFENTIYTAQAKKDGKKLKSVIVYSTPTCSWCTTLKSYLKNNNIRFREIDVSKDQKAAEAMVKKSGQQGVPQTEVNGQIIVGFDKTKINQMLEIKA
ncbi:MAG: NrdH-redoxin [Bacteroidetes bacterium]|nr:MAG: NrdH-redoxin [Bacteroidota bacterium]